MTTRQELTQRHADIKERLISAKDKFANRNTLAACKYIGDNLGSSAQTVYNYLQGRIKDGYLAEAILKELKKYKPNN